MKRFDTGQAVRVVNDAGSYYVFDEGFATADTLTVVSTRTNRHYHGCGCPDGPYGSHDPSMGCTAFYGRNHPQLVNVRNAAGETTEVNGAALVHIKFTQTAQEAN